MLSEYINKYIPTVMDTKYFRSVLNMLSTCVWDLRYEILAWCFRFLNVFLYLPGSSWFSSKNAWKSICCDLMLACLGLVIRPLWTWNSDCLLAKPALHYNVMITKLKQNMIDCITQSGFRVSANKLQWMKPSEWLGENETSKNHKHHGLFWKMVQRYA